jgi:hypothetical protein
MLTITDTTKRDGHFIAGFSAATMGNVTKRDATARAVPGFVPHRVCNRFWSGWALVADHGDSITVLHRDGVTTTTIGRANG